MFGLSLQTKICPDGVELVDKPAVSAGAPGPGAKLAGTIAGGFGLDGIRPAETVFQFRTERRKDLRIEIKNLKNSVVAKFIDARDDKTRAEFLSEVGLLAPPQGSYGREETTAYDVLRWQDHLAQLLAHISRSKPAAGIAAVNATLATHRTFSLEPTLQAGQKKTKPQISFACQNLLGLMLMEVGLIAAYGARAARCQHCHRLFITGPFTGRRATAKFCHRNCRQAALRDRQKY
jgi:hypothetical protein